MSDRNSTQRVLDYLVRAKTERLRAEIVPGKIYGPEEYVPLFALRGHEIGGDAANMRLWELKRDIPIKKLAFFYDGANGKTKKVILYTINLKTQNIKRFINFDTCKLIAANVAAAGGMIVEWYDSAKDEHGNSHDTKGKTVKIVLQKKVEPATDEGKEWRTIPAQKELQYTTILP